MKFPRIALLEVSFSAKELRNHLRGVTDVYLVNPSAKVTADLTESGFSVHVLANVAEIPANVFRYFERVGHWGAVNIESGFVRDVVFAENSHQAAILLLSNYADGYREQFIVKPVNITIADGY